MTLVEPPTAGTPGRAEHAPIPWPRAGRQRVARTDRAAWLSRVLRISAWHPLLRALVGCALVLVVLTGGTFVWLWRATPSPVTLESWIEGQDAAHHTPYVTLDHISPWMGKALVAIEDERFYQHHGIDTIGLLRAAWDDLRAGRLVEGGSTLTAQLAKNAYLDGNDHAFARKVQDLVLALKVERVYSKDEILEMYLNLVYYGEGAYGIQAAAERYFSVTPAQLDIAQSALLAGLVQAPGWFDPWCHPADARARQATVLSHMVDGHDITQSQANAALREPLAPLLPGVARPADIYCAR